MQEERKKILEMIQDGKLTAEEAMGLLEDLEKASQESEAKEQKLQNELSTVVVDKKSEGSTQDTFKKNIQSSKEKIIDFVESAFKKIKETDLDFNFGKSVEVSHIFQHDYDFLNEVDVDIANGKVKIATWNQKDVRVECHAKVYRVEDIEEARKNFLEEVEFSIEDGKMKFKVREKAIKVDTIMYIPRKEYEDIHVRLFNGAITTESLKSENLKAKTANGAIHIMQGKGDSCELETGNGMITISDTNFNDLEAETLNGAINAAGYFKKLDVQTFNGEIVCSNFGMDCDSIHAKSITGKVKLILPPGKAIEGELKSNLGSFNVSLEGMTIIEEKSDVVQKVLKFKTVKEEVPVLHVFAETKTAAITVS
ncbi:DUF4097 family beta strand repeat-containing protein [Peribacillus sp. NPDC097895]|uniref:DUF4097 family beta strand repeat-containing protein n=1 Tax=Peribacillus sp. NPDC097895 TaxID=3390619 RepID=UPI003D03D958